MNVAALVSIIGVVEQNLQLMRTLLAQPSQQMRMPNQHQLSPQEEQFLGQAVEPEFPPAQPQFQGYPPPQYQQPAQGYQQPAYLGQPQQPQMQIPPNQVAANKLLQHILNGGGGN